MTRIHATGTSEAHYRAERATILAQISITSTDRSESIRIATQLHNWASSRAQQLRESGDATWHAANPISTWTRKSYAQGSKSKVIVEHITSSQVRVKLSNLELVSELVTEFSEAGLHASVEWALTEDSRRAYEQSARKAAVGEAQEIAEDYANALGERVTRVVTISDTRQTAFGGPPARAMAVAGGGQTELAEVTVPEITVSATVSGEFESA
ncbi:MAG: SIMPL domain-containing protein [Gulosibacter sp.]|uniref:SIMPL domain-containing protein n=1 Tax=Gulosibacter sp. TaxID=2817531 RepID=UPI003F93934C